MNILKITNQESLGAAIGPINLQPQYGFTSLNEAINTLVSLVFFFGALAAFFYLLLGAFRYIIAGAMKLSFKEHEVPWFMPSLV